MCAPRTAFQPAYRLALSDDGLAFIAKWEGFRADAYKPVPTEKYWTVGFGHYGPDVHKEMHVTRDQALALLHRDTTDAQNAVRQLVKVPLTPSQFDALTSLIFNIGGGAFAESTLLRELNAWDYRAAGNQFLRWNKSGSKVLLGLSRRRRAERKKFLLKETQ
jgi:GH24 family phage-related lysozyme (muramidase)